MKYTRKSQIKGIFEEWLNFMQTVHERLSKKEFRELEDKIRAEIAFHRKRKK